VIDPIVIALQAAVWMWAISGLFLTAAIGAVAYLLGRLVFDAIARTYRAQHHDVGPDALRLLQELDVHLDQTAARDPELAAGLHRLHAAIHEAREGEL
jgi:hypothetical protein